MGLAHQHCPDCDSSDALLINDDGSTHCFSCGKHTAAREGYTKSSLPSEFLKGKAIGIDARCLKQDTCKKYRYNTTTYKGQEVQVATYRDLNDKPIFQKVRFTENKEFFIIVAVFYIERKTYEDM